MASLTICELMAYLLVVWIAKGKVEGNLAESERERERDLTLQMTTQHKHRELEGTGRIQNRLPRYIYSMHQQYGCGYKHASFIDNV